MNLTNDYSLPTRETQTSSSDVLMLFNMIIAKINEFYQVDIKKSLSTHPVVYLAPLEVTLAKYQGLH